MRGDSLTIAIGSLAAALPDAVNVDLGPTHPMRAGLITLVAKVDKGVLTSVNVAPGGLQRGAEKLFEVRDYRQGLSLANRHDWQAPIFGEILLASVVEESLGVTVPPRAAWLRVLLAEHFRIGSHLAYLVHLEDGRAADASLAGVARAAILEQNLVLTGNRVHPMVVRLGGLSANVPNDWLQAERGLTKTIREVSNALRLRLEHLAERLGGLAVTTPSVVSGHGLTGPVSAAAGIDLDLRRGDPRIDPRLSELLGRGTQSAGDALARFRVLIDQLDESCDLIDAVADGLPEGPVDVRLPKVVRVPEGDFHGAIEAPWGHAGMLLVSRGQKTPWRLKLRTPGFANLSAWEAVLPGTPLERLADAVRSLPALSGDVTK